MSSQFFFTDAMRTFELVQAAVDQSSAKASSIRLAADIAKQAKTEKWGTGRSGTDGTGKKVEGVDPKDLSRVYTGGIGTIPAEYPALPPTLQGRAFLAEMEYAYYRLPRPLQEFLQGERSGEGSNITLSAFDMESDTAKWFGQCIKDGDTALKSGLENELKRPLTELEISAIISRKGHIFSLGLDDGKPKESFADIVGASLGGLRPSESLEGILGPRIVERDREEDRIQSRCRQWDKKTDEKDSEENNDDENDDNEDNPDYAGPQGSDDFSGASNQPAPIQPAPIKVVLSRATETAIERRTTVSQLSHLQLDLGASQVEGVRKMLQPVTKTKFFYASSTSPSPLLATIFWGCRPLCFTVGCKRPAAVVCLCAWGSLCAKSRRCVQCDTYLHTFINPGCPSRYTISANSFQVVSLLPNHFLSAELGNSFLSLPEHIEFRAVPAPFTPPTLCGVKDCAGAFFTPFAWNTEEKSGVSVLSSNPSSSFVIGAVTVFKCDTCGEPHSVPTSFVDSLVGSASLVPIAPYRVRAHIMEALTFEVTGNFHFSTATGIPSEALAKAVKCDNVDSVRVANYAHRNKKMFESTLAGALHLNCIQCGSQGIDTAADGNMKMSCFKSQREDTPVSSSLLGALVGESIVKQLYSKWNSTAVSVVREGGKKGGRVLWDPSTVSHCLSGSGEYNCAKDKSSKSIALEYSGAFIIACKHGNPLAAFPLLNSGEGMLPVLIAILLCLACGGKSFQMDTACMFLKMRVQEVRWIAIGQTLTCIFFFLSWKTLM